MMRRQFWLWYPAAAIGGPIVTLLLSTLNGFLAVLLGLFVFYLLVDIIAARLRDAGRRGRLVLWAMASAVGFLLIVPIPIQVLSGGGDTSAILGIAVGVAGGFLGFQGFAVWAGSLPSAAPPPSSS